MYDRRGLYMSGHSFVNKNKNHCYCYFLLFVKIQITYGINYQQSLDFFSIRAFFNGYWRYAGQQRNGGDLLLFYSTTSTLSRTFRHLFATLHVRWLPHIFNRNGCIYQTVTRWDWPPYLITIWFIDWWCNVCLFTWWFDSRFFVTAIWHGKPLDLSWHRLSPLYYRQTD